VIFLSVTRGEFHKDICEADGSTVKRERVLQPNIISEIPKIAPYPYLHFVMASISA
jgi:hypothetical protein